MATLLPLDVALELREKLIEYAINTKDHTVSDTFVQLLKLRSPQLLQNATQQVSRQEKQKTKYLDLAAKFLEFVGGKIKSYREYLTIQTIEGSLSTYTPLLVLLTWVWSLMKQPPDKSISKAVDTHLSPANLLAF